MTVFFLWNGIELGVVKYSKIDQRIISFIDLAVVEINVVEL